MACITTSPEELYNRLKRGNQIIDNTKVNDVASFMEALDDLNNLPVDSKYDNDGNRFYSLYGHQFSKSASDVVKNRYKRRSGSSEKMMRPLGTGTIMHSVIQDLLSLYFDAYENGVDLDNVKTSNFWKSNEFIFENNFDGKKVNVFFGSNPERTTAIQESFESLAKMIINDAISNQRKINPTGKFKIRIEQRLINPKIDMIGHQDLMIVFSDLTVWDVDFKSKGVYDLYKNKKRTLARRALSESQIEDYGTQMRNYRDAKKGFDKVRVTRSIIIPIIYSEQSSKKEDEVVIHSVYTGFENKASAPIATKLSRLEDQSINQVIDILYSDLDKLRESINRQKDEALKESLKSKANNLFEIIQAVSLLNISGSTYEEIRTIVNSNLSNINNINTLSEKRLEELENQLNVISSVHDVFVKIFDNEQNHSWIVNNQQLLSSLNDIIKYYSIKDVKIKTLLSRVKSERLSRALDKVDPDFKTGDSLKMGDTKGWITKNLEVYDQIDNPIIQEISKLYLRQEKRAIDDYNKRVGSLINVATAAFRYGKEKLGLNQTQVQSMLVNHEKGKMTTIFTEKYYEEIQEAILNEDIDWLKERFYIEDEAEYIEKFEKRYQNRRNQIIKDLSGDVNAINESDIFKDEYDELNEDVIIWSKEDKLKRLKNDLALFTNRNNLLTSNKAWYNKNNVIFNTRLKDIYSDKYKSEQYKKLEQHKPILDYYKALTELYSELRELLGVDYQKLPPTFIPSFKRELVENFTAMFGGISGIKQASKEMHDWLRDAVSSNEIDKIEFNDNGPKSWTEGSVPIMGLQDLKSEIKSYDLLTSALLFMKSAYLNIHLTESLPEARSLLSLLDVKNSESRNFVQISNTSGEQSSVYEIAENMLAYKWLGKRYKDAAELNEHKIFGMELGKSLLSLRNMNILTKLGFNFVSAGGSALAAVGRGFLIAMGHHSYSKKTWNSTVKELKNFDRVAKMRIIAEYFNVSAEGQVRRDVRKNIKGLNKWLRSEGLMFPWTFGDDKTSYLIATAIAKDWTFDEDGNMARLEDEKKVRPDAVSIYDMFEINTKNENEPFKIKNGEIKEESWVQFHKAVRATMLETTGQLNDKELMGLQNTIKGTMFSTYKGWFPAIVRAEFGKLKYSSEFSTIKEGRIRSAYSNWFGKADPNEKFINTVIPKLLTFTKDFIADTFMYMSGSNNRAERLIKEKYIRAEFEKWQYDNPILARKLGKTYEEQLKKFIEGKKRNILIALGEIRVVLTIGVLLMIAKSLDFDDDDEPDYKQYYASRQMMKLLTKFHMEFRTPIDLREWYSVMDTKIPAFSTITGLSKAFSNTIDETRDFVFGEDSKLDKSPPFHYTRKEIPLLNPFFKIFDFIYEDDIKNDPLNK
jgi:hypothetical protein